MELLAVLVAFSTCFLKLNKLMKIEKLCFASQFSVFRCVGSFGTWWQVKSKNYLMKRTLLWIIFIVFFSTSRTILFFEDFKHKLNNHTWSNVFFVLIFLIILPVISCTTLLSKIGKLPRPRCARVSVSALSLANFAQLQCTFFFVD